MSAKLSAPQSPVFQDNISYTMNIWYRTTSLVLAVVAMVFFAACDQSEQNVGWEPGDDLTIAATSAPVKMTLPTDTESTTAEFYNPVYTQNNNYTWEVMVPDPEVNDVAEESTSTSSRPRLATTRSRLRRFGKFRRRADRGLPGINR